MNWCHFDQMRGKLKTVCPESLLERLTQVELTAWADQECADQDSTVTTMIFVWALRQYNSGLGVSHLQRRKNRFCSFEGHRSYNSMSGIFSIFPFSLVIRFAITSASPRYGSDWTVTHELMGCQRGMCQNVCVLLLPPLSSKVIS